MTTSKSSTRIDRNGLIVLSREECLHLLRQVTFGRIAITIDALPVILPVNFRLVDECIVFTTNSGSKLDAATVGAVVSFEADGIDPLSHSGWSVIVTGVANAVADPAKVAEFMAANIPRWASGEGECFITVPISLISGRVLYAGLCWEDRPVRITAAEGRIHLGITADVALPGR